MKRMREFVRAYLDPNVSLSILDVGSLETEGTEGTYRTLFDNRKWSYTGIDIRAGKNVDVVVERYDWNLGTTFDVVVLGQCLEHVENMTAWCGEIKKHTRAGGLVCIIAPWNWGEHRFPVDCWRILPDGMRYLLGEVCGFAVLSVFKKHKDCVGIARHGG